MQKNRRLKKRQRPEHAGSDEVQKRSWGERKNLTPIIGSDYHVINKAPFESIEFLRNQFLKTDGSPNGAVFALVFRN
jgi:hypothetical protein